MSPSSLYRPLQPPDQLYFLHIQKTAGTTFTALLDSRFAREDVCPAQSLPPFLELPAEQRQNYRLYRGHFSHFFYVFLPRMPVYITMLRHPVERVISNIRHIRRYPEHRYHHMLLNSSLLSFVTNPQTRFELSNLQARMIAPRVPTDIEQRLDRIQSLPTHEIEGFFESWSRDPGDSDACLERLDQFAFWGLANRFDESVALLSYTFGWRPFTSVVKLNAAPATPDEEAFGPDVIEAIKATNQIDIALFDQAQKRFELRYNQMVFELLQAHYRSVANTATPPASTHIKVDFQQPIPGDNWHEYEENTQRGYRWTGPQTVSTLDLILQPGISYNVEVEVLAGITEDVLNSFRLAVNEQPISLRREASESGFRFRGIIPAAYLRPAFKVTRFTLHVDKTYKPAELGMNLDPRALGVAVAAFAVSPYAGA